MVEISSHLQRHAPDGDAFEWLLNQRGSLHREVKNRRTQDFEVGGRRFFIKVHHGCGWREIFKNLFQLRLPILSARNEWEAIERLQVLGIPTPILAGKGLRGRNPACLQSFVVTEALEGMVSLENLVRGWGGMEPVMRQRLKDAIIEELAAISRKLHMNGINHRDLYLCHFLVGDRDWSRWTPGDSLGMVLIDLHRVQMRRRAPKRWIVKDLAGLLCSSYDWGVTRRDLVKFIRHYSGRGWSAMPPGERRFWKWVWRRAHGLYTGFYKREPGSVI